MKLSTRIAAALTLGTLISTPVFAKPICYSQSELRAMQVRQMHYELMVAALKCRGGEVDFNGKWASYVDRFGPTMNRNADQLRVLFKRLGKGQAGMDRFATQLSNDASIRAQYVVDYCGVQAALFDSVMAQDPRKVDEWVVDKIEQPISSPAACSAPVSNSVRQAKADAPAAGKTKAKNKAATKTAGEPTTPVLNTSAHRSPDKG